MANHLIFSSWLKAVRAAIVAVVVIAASSAVSAYASDQPPAGIATRQATLGTIFMTADGFSLYTYQNDTPDKSTCNDKCAVAWPPLIAPPDAQPTGAWSVIVRNDGTKQWAFDGHPLYKYKNDVVPGVTYGEGAQKVWHLAVDLAPRPRDVTYRGAFIGRVAADLKGMTLYISDKDSATGQGCTGACLLSWTPLKAPEAALPIGDWSPIQRADDGTPQWAYKGKPLYRYVNDAAPGDTNGDGVEKNWHPIVMEPLPPAPSWVTTQQSEFGTIFADSQGKTLYYLQAKTLEAFEALSCLDACFREHFKPVLADNGVKAPGGSWTIIPNRDGKMQWAYRGDLIYTFAEDTSPGDIKGEKFGISTDLFGWEVLDRSRMLPPVM